MSPKKNQSDCFGVNYLMRFDYDHVNYIHSRDVYRTVILIIPFNLVITSCVF